MVRLLPIIALVGCSAPSLDDLLDDVEVQAATFGPLPDGTQRAWVLDVDASPQLGFEAEGLFGVPANGVWTRYNVRVAALGDGPETWQVAFIADHESLETGVPALDTHIRTEDFLHVDAHPQASFVSTDVARADDLDAFRVTGEMTLRGTTRTLQFDAQIEQTDDGILTEATIPFSRWDYRLYAPDADAPGADGASDEVVASYAVRLVEVLPE